jgi:hypothetical protein
MRTRKKPIPPDGHMTSRTFAQREITFAASGTRLVIDGVGTFYRVTAEVCCVAWSPGGRANPLARDGELVHTFGWSPDFVDQRHYQLELELAVVPVR